jgi:hypothetical protein
MAQQADAPRHMVRQHLGVVSNRGLPSSASVWRSDCHTFLSQSVDCFQMLGNNISFDMENHHHIINMTT